MFNTSKIYLVQATSLFFYLNVCLFIFINTFSKSESEGKLYFFLVVVVVTRVSNVVNINGARIRFGTSVGFRPNRIDQICLNRIQLYTGVHCSSTSANIKRWNKSLKLAQKEKLRKRIRSERKKKRTQFTSPFEPLICANEFRIGANSISGW